MAEHAAPRVRRPATARPRRDARAKADGPQAPDRAELERIERQLTGLAEVLGATASADAELGALLVRWPGHGPAFNHASSVRWQQPALATRLAALTARAEADGNLPAIVVADGLTEPSDLADHLRADGWVSLIRERIMWTAEPTVVPHLDPTMRIEAVTPASARAYEVVERAVFGLAASEAEERAATLAASLESGLQRAYLVRARGTPIATARLVVRDGIAALHGIGVIADQRRRGYGTLVAIVASRAALAMGSRLVWLSVAEENAAGRGLYERLGYRHAFDWQLLVQPVGRSS